MAQFVSNLHEARCELSSMAPSILPHVVVSLHALDAGSALTVALGDGSIRFLDPLTMADLSNERDVNKVSSFPQAGFVYPISDSGWPFCSLGCIVVLMACSSPRCVISELVCGRQHG